MPLAPIPDEYLLAIGSIVVDFNYLDNLLTTVLIEITGNSFLDINSHIPFVGMNFGIKKDLLDVLIKVKADSGVVLPNVRDFYAILSPKIAQIQTKRNEIAHSSWAHRDGKVFRQRVKAKRNLRMEKVDVTLDELLALIGELEELRTNTMQLLAYIKVQRESPQIGQKENTSPSSSAKPGIVSEALTRRDDSPS